MSAKPRIDISGCAILIINRVEDQNLRAEKPPNKRLQPTWLISALYNASTRIAVSCLAEVFTPYPPSG